MDKLTFSLNKNVTDIISKLFKDFNLNLSQPKQLAQKIVKLSENYQKELSDHSDIWQTNDNIQAYLSYFLPLNIIRLSSVIDEANKHLNFKNLNAVYDYGSGPGTGQLSFLNTGFSSINFYNFDKSKVALDIHQSWADPTLSFFTDQLSLWNNIHTNSLGLLSYSLNELANLPTNLFNHDHLLIIEPSNQKPARRLQKFRNTFQDKGYNIIAPCTHQGSCPLLNHSKKDWCHNRVFTKLPLWFLDLEHSLPMKNANLTYSYLFLSKTINPNTNKFTGRVIGDQQKEKGKTKQAFCRGEEREFLAWLKKDGHTPHIPRGSTFNIKSDFIKKGNEIRNL